MYFFTKRAEVIKNNFQVCGKQSAFSFQHFLMDSVWKYSVSLTNDD